MGSNYRVRASFDGDIQKLAYEVEHAEKVISIGSSLEIVKDVGSAHEVDDHYGVSGFHGTHGLGHVADDRVAVASEEVSLNRLFPGQALNIREPPPATRET